MAGKRVLKEGEVDWDNIKIPKYADVHVRLSLNKENVTSRMNAVWNGAEDDLADLNVNVWSEPFKCVEVKDFLYDDDFVGDLRDELVTLDLNEKNNDLYQFEQSDDLSTSDEPEVETLIRFLKGKGRTWIEAVTGFQLSEKVDATYSRYKFTDHLLCHDDKCETRKIAFILYCNRIWFEEEGGTLQLFGTDVSNQPSDVVRSIVPAYNKFVFFEVSDKSFHQVLEVTSKLHYRITVNGWFHGAEQSSPSPFLELAASKFTPNPEDGYLLSQFVSGTYLNGQQNAEIKEHFTEHSEILLVNFLDNNMYASICQQLRRIRWKTRGPPNRRCYEVAIESIIETLPYHLRKFLRLMKSRAMFELLSKFTNLDLTGQKKKGNPQCSYEMQQWTAGSYTLVNDGDPTFEECGLDVVLFFNIDDLEEGHGGFTSYIARGADEELLTITPTENAMALTYRDKDTLRFVKYVNHRFQSRFHTIAFSYYE